MKTAKPEPKVRKAKFVVDGNMTFGSRAKAKIDEIWEDADGLDLAKNKIWVVGGISDAMLEEEESPTSKSSTIKKFKDIKLGFQLDASKWCSVCHQLGRHSRCQEVDGSEFERVREGLVTEMKKMLEHPPSEEGIKDDLILPDRKQLYLKSLIKWVESYEPPIEPSVQNSELQCLNSIVKELNRHYCDSMGFQRPGAFKIRMAPEVRMAEMADSETVRQLLGRVAYLL